MRLKSQAFEQIAEERTKHEAENAELRSRIEQLERGRTDIVAENARRDDAIVELKAEVVKLRDDNEESKHKPKMFHPKKLLMYLSPLQTSVIRRHLM